jgi:CopG family nickel-responsive transcriptional regulator
MKTHLIRFGLAVDYALLADFDALVEKRGCTRSELFRDLARTEVSRARTSDNGLAVATLTLVYDHHVRELTEKLTELQHQLGDAVRCALHLHLNQDDCLEVIVMSGRADELRAVADRISATRGVKHGRVEIIAHEFGSAGAAGAHDHERHEHERHEHEHPPKQRAAATRAKRSKAAPATRSRTK